MNKVKPYIPVLIINAKQPLEPVINKQEYIIAFRLDAVGDAVSRRNIELLIKGNCPFIVLVNPAYHADNGQMVETFELIELCLFSKSYFRIANIPVIAFEAAGDAGMNAWTGIAGAANPVMPAHRLAPEMLIPHLQQQGWSSVHQWTLSSGLSFREQIRGKKTPPLLLNHIDFDEQFLRENFFLNPSYLGDYIFFNGGPDDAHPTDDAPGNSNFTNSSMALEQGFHQLCLPTIGNNHLWEVSLREYLAAKNSVSELSKKNNMLQEMLNNAETTITLIKDTYKKDYHRLFKWYHKEYEMLPLWYKRFGHLIKAFKGQRSFRSLFDGSNRKYAD